MSAVMEQDRQDTRRHEGASAAHAAAKVDRGKRDFDKEIEDVERRLALQRERLSRDADELRAAAKRAAKPLPIIGIVALAALGFALASVGRRRSSRRRALHAYREGYRDALHRGYRPPGRASTIGKAAAVAGAAVRFGLSPQGQLLWHAIKQRRRQARSSF